MINLFRTLEEATTAYESPISTRFLYRGIQLLPNNEKKYVQKTEIEGGINLEDWSVFLIDCRGNRFEVTDNFFVEKRINANDGTPQIIWSLTNIPYDLGWGLVYMEVSQLIGETFYSSMFSVTDIRKEFTSQIHYKLNKNDDFLSIGVQLWYYDKDRKTTLKSYYETSTKQTVTYAVSATKYSVYKTEVINKDVLLDLSEIFEHPYVYIKGVRCYLFEPANIPQKKHSENFVQGEFLLSENEKDSFSNLVDYLDIDYGNLDYNT